MLFFSYEYIFAFLPVTVGVYFWLCRRRLTEAAKGWLVFTSLFFYSWWEVSYLPLILASILFNWAVSASIHDRHRFAQAHHRGILAFGIFGNLALLGFYKYTDFMIGNVNLAFGTQIQALGLVLPLAISFFTFQQIAFLVDSYKGVVKERNFLDYSLFVTFFPQLISGPIVHHKEMMPQFASLKEKVLSYPNLARGMFIFSIGLLKKVLIADTFAIWAIAGFDKAEQLTVPEGWVTSLCYTLQLYFDFSGYMDMALGAALMLNIRLPINFDSPYKALSIRDFWRRWHITLSRFLRDYLYIPLGGNRRGESRAAVNLLVTFLLGGLWHGAGWTFIFWGALHGLGAAIHRLWMRGGLKLPVPLAWGVTFLFVNCAWVFFRAVEWGDAIKVLGAMAGITAARSTGLAMANIGAGPVTVALVLLGLVVCVAMPNSHALAERFRPTLLRAVMVGATAGATAIYVVIDKNRVTEFIYFGF